VILEHLREEEITTDDEVTVNSAILKLKRLEFQENERAQENTLHMKELEVEEKELAMQVRLKELKTSAAPLPLDPGSSKPAGFDTR